MNKKRFRKAVTDKFFIDKILGDISIIICGLLLITVLSCSTDATVQKETYSFIEHLLKIIFEGLAGLLTAGAIIYRLYIAYKQNKKIDNE